MPSPPALFKYGARLGAPGDQYNKFPLREGSCVLSVGNLGLPSLHGDLLYSSPGAPSLAPYLNCAGGDGNDFGPPFQKVIVPVLLSLGA